MNFFNVTKKDLSNLKRVGAGEEAIIYQFDEDKVLKLYRQPEKKKAGKIILLSNMQKYIEKTRLPLGPVYHKLDFIGCIHHYHQNTHNFDSLIENDNPEYCLDKFRQLNDNLDELITNDIYFDDLDSHNVLITPEHKVELIDTDSAYISDDNHKKIYIYRQLKSMILEILFNEEYYFNDEEIMSKQKIRQEYIDYFVNNQLSYDLFHEFFNYLEKDKVLVKKREV
ncbi:MAG: hypothetical protein PHO63_04820 [Bacilli bacterium]|nr:hypothetical protein [Bacilli bacterium]MDD4808810.1 hypothetical protein [Bacilli bacterium]